MCDTIDYSSHQAKVDAVGKFIIIIIIIINVIYMAQIRIHAANAPCRLLQAL